MNWKPYLLEIITAYSAFACIILNLLGMSLSFQKQSYEWNIKHVKNAQYQLLKSALLHLFMLIGCFIWKTWKRRFMEDEFMLLQEEEDIN